VTRRSVDTDRIPAVWLVLTGIVSVQFGAALAKDLFGQVPPTALVWLRFAASALVLFVVARPRLRGRSRRDWLVVAAFGVNLTIMNWSFYQSFARIPLGIAVTIEFLGPLAVAVLGSRRPLDLVWVALAGSGVALLGLSRVSLNVAGVLFALVAGLCWAFYILLSQRTGRRWSGLSGLSVAGLVGAVVLAAPAIVVGGEQLLQPRVLLLGLAIGLLSSAIPYSLELISLRRIPPHVFGILMSLEPAVAAVTAMVILAEFLSPGQWVAVACVIAASVGATYSARRARTAG
jgi:inner membrane transporter RhtA